MELRPLKLIFLLAVASLNWTFAHGDAEQTRNLISQTLERSDRLGFVRNERTDSLFELADFKLKYYSLQKEFDELQETCAEARSKDELLGSIQENSNAIEILKIQVDHLMLTKNTPKCTQPNVPTYSQMEEKLNDLRWIQTLINERYNENQKNKTFQSQLEHQIAFDEWLKQFQKVIIDFENQVLRSPLAQEVAIGTLLDYPELRNLAYQFYEEEKYVKAVGLFEMIFKRQNATLGPDHPKTLDTQHKLALCLDRLNEHSKALELLKNVFEKRSETLGPNHEMTLRAWQIIGWVLHNQGKYREALNLYRNVYEKQAKFLGIQHPDTQHTKANMEYIAKEIA